MSTVGPTVADLFPDVVGVSPFDVTVGEAFDTVALPAAAARRLLDLCDHLHPHPVGAAIARGNEWVLILPPGSGKETDWPWPADFRDAGLLTVPPWTATAEESLHWGRRGNEYHRVFTAPVPLGAVLPLLTPVPPTVLPASASSSCSRIPVGI
ncbi:hypothetical protein ACFYY1_30325 [Streptomyces sp. NPDC001890]|uniref:hypothetical protein n=1 Tax=Streptomyces sp. NPDC001890 TaxID=3364620 RepID=UPI0036A2B2FD